MVLKKVLWFALFVSVLSLVSACKTVVSDFRKTVASPGIESQADEAYMLWLKKNRTKKSGNYPTPSLPSLVIVLSGLRQKKEKVVNSSSLLFSFRPTASFITSQ